MVKTRKRGLQKQVRQKYKSKKIGGTKNDTENEVPYLIGEALNETSKKHLGQEFSQKEVLSQILEHVPRESITEAIANAPYKEEVTKLLSKKFTATNSVNSAIASKIINSVPTTYITSARQKADVIKKLKIARQALYTYIAKAQPIHDRYEEAVAVLSNLEDKRDTLESSIGPSKLREYNNLQTNSHRFTGSGNGSAAVLSYIKQRVKKLRCCGFSSKFDALDALKTKIDSADQIYSQANNERIAAYDEQDRLTIIVRDLEREFNDLRNKERIENSKTRVRSIPKPRRRSS